MLIQFLADATRNPKLLEEYVLDPEKVLKKYPGITKAQRAHLDERHVDGVALAAASEIQSFCAQQKLTAMYAGDSIAFKSLTPDSGCTGTTVQMTLLLQVKAAQILRNLQTSATFLRPRGIVKARVSRTTYNSRSRIIKVSLSARFPTRGMYQLNVKIRGKSPVFKADQTFDRVFDAE